MPLCHACYIVGFIPMTLSLVKWWYTPAINARNTGKPQGSHWYLIRLRNLGSVGKWKWIVRPFLQQNKGLQTLLQTNKELTSIARITESPKHTSSCNIQALCSWLLHSFTMLYSYYYYSFRYWNSVILSILCNLWPLPSLHSVKKQQNWHKAKMFKK